MDESSELADVFDSSSMAEKLENSRSFEALMR